MDSDLTISFFPTDYVFLKKWSAEERRPDVNRIEIDQSTDEIDDLRSSRPPRITEALRSLFCAHEMETER